MLTAADVHVAMRLGRLGREPSESVQLAAALAVRAVRLGSVCIELATVASSVALDEESAGLSDVAVPDLPWPEPERVGGGGDAPAAWSPPASATTSPRWRRAVRCASSTGCSTSTATGSRSR